MRRLAPLLAVSLLLVPAPVEADCEPYPGDEWAPAGFAGCEIEGRTDGIVSTWNGEVAAANWCLWPWQDCTTVSVQSHLTGVTIIITPAQFCMCWWGVTGPNGETQRLIDLTPEQVWALGLDPRDGLFPVTVTPVREANGVLPDTSTGYNQWRRYELPTVESQAVPVRGAHTFLGRGRLHPRGMSS